MKKFVIPVLVLLAAAGCAGGTRSEPHVFNYTVSTNGTQLFPDVLKIALSEDAKHYALCFEEGGKYFVFSDGSKSGPYDSVDGLEYTGNILWYAYSEGSKWHLVIGGKNYGTYDEVGGVSVSPDGNRVAYSFRSGGSAYSAAGSAVSGPYDSAGKVVWLRDGSIATYALHASNFVRLNGSVFYQGEYPVEPTVTSNLSNYGFVYKQNDKYYVRIGNTNFGGWQTLWGPVFDGGGNRYGFYYRTDDDDAYVYVGGSGTKGPYNMAGLPEFSANGKRYAYWYFKGGREYVCIDGTNYGGYKFASGGYFSADGSTSAFRFVLDDTYGIERNGKVLYTKPMQKFDLWSPGLKLSPDGSLIAFWYRLDSREYLEINGKTFGGYDSLGRAENWQDTLVFSGTNYAFWYNDGGLDYIVLNGTATGEGADEAGAPFFYGADGKLAYWFAKGDYEYVYNGGTVMGPYEAATFRITPDGKMTLLSIKNGRLSLRTL